MIQTYPFSSVEVFNGQLCQDVQCLFGLQQLLALSSALLTLKAQNYKQVQNILDV